MALDFTNATGNLFNRLGKHGKYVNAVNAFRGTTGTPNVNTMTNDIRDQFLTSNSQILEGLWDSRDGYRAVHGTVLNDLVGFMEDTIIAMVNDDVILTSLDLDTAIAEVIKQMGTQAKTVQQPTVSVSVAPDPAVTNIGQGTVTCSLIGPDGITRFHVFNENIDCTCDADSNTGASEGQESFAVRGDAAETDQLSWYWPRGSGASTSLVAVTATENAGTNLLTNGALSGFTVANTPDNFEILVGVAGTDIFSAGSADALGATGNALKFTGTGGAPLSSVAQRFNQTSGFTTSALLPSTVYAVNGFIKKSAGLAAGTIEISLVDGSNVIIQNQAGANNAFTRAAGSITTTYAAFSGFFQTPKSLPTLQKLRVRVSVALTSGESAFIDHLAMTPALELYPGGPFAAAFSHTTKFIVGDRFIIAVSNNYGGAWMQIFERAFRMRERGRQLPASGAPNIADSLLS